MKKKQKRNKLRPFSFDEHCFSVKYVDKKTVKITLEEIEKIWGEASICEKPPFLKIGIRRNEKEIFLITCSVELKKYR